MNTEDLFSNSNKIREPLAARMRPRNLDEYIGQDHIVGKGRLLRRAIAADQLTSVIFYGPPGSGKTTLARVIANHTKSNFITLNAVLTGVADIRTAIKQAEDYFNLYNRRTILFVDEVHRWNKSQQDALLPWVENGTIILIGATTENPFFEVNKALVSRSRVFQLKPLTKEDLLKAAQQALLDKERGYGKWKITFEDGALEHLIETANGDARSLLNALELAVETTPERWEPYSKPPIPEIGSTIYISKEAAEESIQKKVVLYDRDGDYHYDIISAFIKSLRGRDPDAACYWLARMVIAGEDPHFIFRRMLISACEDTGLADPQAVSVVESCAQAFDRVGMPEGRYFLAHAALYLSTAPKSNSSMAFFDALSSVEKEDAEVPNHLKDANRDAEGFGHGAGYLYPHAYRDHWVAQQYLPDALMGRVFYTPSTQGYEASIRNDVLSRRELQIAAILEKQPEQNKNNTNNDKFENPISQWWIDEHFKNSLKNSEENLTFSPLDNARENALDKADRQWRSRIDSNRAEILLGIRNTMIESANLLRHHRSLIWNADDGLLLWEVSRKTPEGITCGVCRSQKGLEIIEQYSRTLGDLDRPILQFRPENSAPDFLNEKDFKNLLLNFQYKGTVFDRIFFKDPFTSLKGITVLAESFEKIAFPNSQIGKTFTDQENAEEELQSELENSEECDISEDFLHSQENENLTSNESESPLANGWKVIISQKIPCSGQHIAALIKEQILSSSPEPSYNEILQKMEKAESDFFSNKENPLFNWDANTIVEKFTKMGFKVNFEIHKTNEKRRITQEEIKKWFDKDSSAYGKKIALAVGIPDLQKMIYLLENAIKNTILTWHTETAFFVIEQNSN